MALGTITTPSFTIQRAFTITSFVDGMTLAEKQNEWRIYYDSNLIYFEIYESGGTSRLVSTNELQFFGVADDGAWHFLDIEIDSVAETLLLRVDNQVARAVNTSGWSYTWREDTGTIFLNGNDVLGGPNPWHGALDEIILYPTPLTDLVRDEIYNFWLGGSPGAVYGSVSTIAFDDNFGLTSLVNSYRGKVQFRQNYRTSDTTYPGTVGDYAVGVPTPVIPPQVSVDVEGDPTGLNTDTRFYLMTYVNDLGFESAPGPITEEPIYVGEDTNVTIAYPRFSDIAYEAAVYDSNEIEDYIPIREARIYRTNTGTSETGYQFVRAVALLRDSDPQATFPDVTNDDLGELLITDNWDVPPPEVTTGCKMANGTYVLAHEYRIHFSVPGVTYAFPVLYNRVLKHRALHLEAIGTSAILLTDGGPHLVAGASGDTMEVIELPFTQVPTSVRGVSTYLDLVIFPAQDGLHGIDANGRVTNLTEDIFEEDQWRSEIPLTDIVSEVYDSTYYGLYYNNSDTGYRGFAFNLKTREWVWLDDGVFDGNTITGVFYDRQTDSLYMADDSTTELLEWEPHVTEYPVLEPTNPFVDTDPLIYWNFDETSGTTFADTADNEETDTLTNSLTSDSDASLLTTTMPGGLGNAIQFVASGNPGRLETSVQSGSHGVDAADSPSSIFVNQTDFTFFFYLTREDTSVYSGGFDFGSGTIPYGDIHSLLIGYGSEGPSSFSLFYWLASDELRLTWSLPDGNYQGVLVSNFSTFFPLSEKVCFRFEGDGNTGVVTAYAGTAVMGSLDLSGEFDARNGDIDWRFDSGSGFSDSGLFLGAGFTYVEGGELSWIGKKDQGAYFNRKLTVTEVQNLCAGPSTPAGLVPAPWRWWTKEFIIPQRSFGAVKIMGRLDATNSVEVTYEVDGVDQPLFPLIAGQPVGVCIDETFFRLPAVRGQRMRLKLRTFTGSPVVESLQIAVHPMEIV